MRKHDIHSQIEGDISAEYIQNKINIYMALYVKKALYESGMPKEEKLNVIEKLIEYAKNNT